MYPKYLYSKENPDGKLFYSFEEENNLESGWFESPADIGKEEETAPEVKKKGK